ncbi:MAG: formate/nitrite transporter family protein [Solirubrobacterales bacterium]|nr:formate/nitrite transporter family protein [Solirubrobacterales bacterium]
MDSSANQDSDRVRPNATEIYENVKLDAADELSRSIAALAFSGLFAGATVGFGALASAATASALSGQQHAKLIGALFFPIGFIAVIVGRAQLFTENTLYPITLVLDERRHVGATLRLWVIVLAANLVGVCVFALLVVYSGAIPATVVNELVSTGKEATRGEWSAFFWSAIFGGWLLALVAWLVQATPAVIGQIVLIWSLAFVIGVAGFDHCVSTTAEVLCSVFKGHVEAGHFFSWLAAVVLGNIAGGVLIVAVLNYGQVRADDNETQRSR